MSEDPARYVTGIYAEQTDGSTAYLGSDPAADVITEAQLAKWEAEARAEIADPDIWSNAPLAYAKEALILIAEVRRLRAELDAEARLHQAYLDQANIVLERYRDRAAQLEQQTERDVAEVRRLQTRVADLARQVYDHSVRADMAEAALRREQAAVAALTARAEAPGSPRVCQGCRTAHPPGTPCPPFNEGRTIQYATPQGD